MATMIKFAETPEEKEAIYRQRYRVYTEEMNLYRSIADHERKLLYDRYDETARILYASVDGEIIGSLRIHWGADAAFSEEHIETYDLPRFRPIVSDAGMAIVTRFMVDPAHRGGNIPFNMIIACYEFLLKQGMKLTFLDCVPHLINLYLSLGFKAYKANYNDADLGYMVPMVMIMGELEHLQQVRSPLLPFASHHTISREGVEELIKLIPSVVPVQSEAESQQGDYWGKVFGILQSHRPGKISLFEDMSEEDIEDFLSKSHIIDCQPGDRIIRKGTVGRSVFVILSGQAEVREGDRVIATLSEGEVLGEVAFLLRSQRMADVYAATENVRILSLSEKTLQQLMDAESKIAARLLYNLSRVLCGKFVSLHQRAFAPAEN